MSNFPDARVWDAWNNPADIRQWNTAQDDWHTSRSSIDLPEGGKFSARMEARDGSVGFDFEGTYTRAVPKKAIEFRMSDCREVRVEFIERGGWQAILDSFARHVEAGTSARSGQ